jgi:hypothetical protein
MGFCNNYDNEENSYLKTEWGEKIGLDEFFRAKNRSQPAMLRNKSGFPAQQVRGRATN